MTQIETEIEIDAPIECVWRTLINFKNYPSWNPMVISASGKIEEGSNLRIKLQAPIGMAIDLEVKVEKLVKERELRWVGSMPTFNFLLAGDHFYRLEELKQNRTLFHHGEIFTGVLEPFISSILKRQGTPLYQNLNDALKLEVESKFNI